jgi:competence protein ComEA
VVARVDASRNESQSTNESQSHIQSQSSHHATKSRQQLKTGVQSSELLARPSADRALLVEAKQFVFGRLTTIVDRLRTNVSVRARNVALGIVACFVSALIGVVMVSKLITTPRNATTFSLPMAGSTNTSVATNAASTSSPAAGSPSGSGSGAVPSAPIGVLPILTVPPPSSTTTTLVIAVHAAGAVNQPGVFLFNAIPRVDDVIAAAGGLTQDADASGLNLAAPVADGQRIYVPAQGQTIPTLLPVEIAPAVANPGAVGEGAGGAPSGSGSGGKSGIVSAVIDLNTATAEQLDTLPGVGPATANAILEYRQQKGRFRSITELLEVRGIGDAKFASIRPRVKV